MSGAWGIKLNGVYLSGGHDDENLELVGCSGDETINAGWLVEPPDGVAGLPSQRTEDVTYYQRDGVEHFSDWYEPRFITINAAIGPDNDDPCSDCSTPKEQLRALIQASKRQGQTEMVVYTDCSTKRYDDLPIIDHEQTITSRINLFEYNSRGQAYTTNSGVFEFRDTRGFGTGGTGTYQSYSAAAVPSSETCLESPQVMARKDWLTAPSDNNNAGFLHGATGTNAYPVNVGDEYAFSSYMRTNRAGVNLQIKVFFYDAAGSALAGSPVIGETTVSQANTYHRVSTVVTVPTNAAYMQFASDTGNGGSAFQVGDELRVTAAMVEQTGTLGAYFDGDCPDGQVGTTTTSYTWTGTPFESQSMETVSAGTQVRTNLFAKNGRGQAYTTTVGVFEFRDTRGFGSGGTGTYQNYSATGVPSSDTCLESPQVMARKDWLTSPASNGSAGFLHAGSGTSGYPVTPGEKYVMSSFMRTNLTGINLVIRVWFYDAAGAAVGSSVEGDVVVSVANDYHRVSASVTVPATAAYMQFASDTNNGGPLFNTGDELRVTAAMVERTDLLGTYFDGDCPDTDNEYVGGQKTTYDWIGDAFDSESTQTVGNYVAGPNLELNGPFGIVGRPRVAEGRWLSSKRQIWQGLIRFDALDQRMYVLDECGTPGYTKCSTILPGAQRFTACMEVGTGIYAGTGPNGNPNKVFCMTEGGFCMSTTDTTDDSVAPTELGIGGTEKVNPEITLFGPLIRPYVENTTTGEYIELDMTMDEDAQPVTINTEKGTAFDADGNSLTHLLRGSLFLSMYPGNYEWRLLSAGGIDTFEDMGYATVCWRDTVVNA